MVTIAIDHQQIAVNRQLTILEAAEEARIEIPHLCYLRDINRIGAYRIYIVELQDKGKLIIAYNTVVQGGMVIYTNSPRVRYTCRCNVELLLSQHNCERTYCSRSESCSLQKISNDLGTASLPHEKKVMYTPWNQSFPLIRESNKCIKYMHYTQIYDRVQNPQVWDVQNIDSRITVNVSLNRSIEEAGYSLCGQCIIHCPVSALHVRRDSKCVFAAFNGPDKIIIVQIAPTVRAIWGESSGLRREKATVEKLGDAFRRMGTDYVFDTGFVADLTIMEEASEFLERLHHNKEQKIPIFTSCCPDWVRFPKLQCPDTVSHLSTSKSPYQIFGAVTGAWFAEKLGIDPSSIYNISVMLRIARKHEIGILVTNDPGYRGVDVVLTTREVVCMIHAEHIDVDYLQNHPLSDPLGMASGAGMILGAIGGVMEVALHSTYHFATGENADADAFAGVHGIDGQKESTLEIQGIPVRCAIVSGLGNIRRLTETMRRKEAAYDFIEVMACPGGCSGGDGQPIHDGRELAAERADTLYHLDRNTKLHYSHENPPIRTLYGEYLGGLFSELVEKLLHTDHEAWQMSRTERQITAAQAEREYSLLL